MALNIPDNDPFRNVWSYDIEVFTNCFTMTAVNMVNPENVKQFVIWKNINQAKELVSFVRSCYGMIGYNNLGFDYPIIHLCLLVRPTAASKQSGNELARLIFKRTQEIIHQERPMYLNPIVPQRDVYKIWHFDNDAKATSLKWVECAIRWPSVEDSPYSFEMEIENEEMLKKVLHYNLNDVLATRQFYLDKSMTKVKMRKVLSRKFGLRLDNANDAKIGELIVLSGVAKKMGMQVHELKDLITPRSFVDLKDVILPHINFKSKPFQKILSDFRRMRITFTSKKEKMTVVFDGMEYEFGMGGIHAARSNNTFYNISSCDVTSYYPRLAISWNFHPEHLGEHFSTVYEEIFYERTKYPKKTPENDGLKLALNAVFGKSNSAHSALNDIKMFLQITINGQLLLAMLCEELTLSGAARVVMANTDGIEVEMKNEELYHKICKKWEETNKLELEHATYKVLAIRDVNNYIAIKIDGKTKEKGAYEVDKEIHKDHSMRVVSLAVRSYLTTGTPVEEFINNHDDLWDFFMYARAKTGEFMFRDVLFDTGEEMISPAPKTLRYYMSKEGSMLLRKTEKKLDKIHRRQYMMPCNDINSVNFDIMPKLLDRDFYIQEARKLIDAIHSKQLTLFV